MGVTESHIVFSVTREISDAFPAASYGLRARLATRKFFELWNVMGFLGVLGFLVVFPIVA